MHPTRRGRYHVVKDILKYVKMETNEGNIVFDICKEEFIYEKSKMEKRIVCSNFLDDEKMLYDEDLVNFLNEVQDKYPPKEYPKIYIPISLSHSEICLYEVKWQYYIG